MPPHPLLTPGAQPDQYAAPDPPATTALAAEFEAGIAASPSPLQHSTSTDGASSSCYPASSRRLSRASDEQPAERAASLSVFVEGFATPPFPTASAAALPTLEQVPPLVEEPGDSPLPTPSPPEACGPERSPPAVSAAADSDSAITDSVWEQRAAWKTCLAYLEKEFPPWFGKHDLILETAVTREDYERSVAVLRRCGYNDAPAGPYADDEEREVNVCGWFWDVTRQVKERIGLPGT